MDASMIGDIASELAGREQAGRAGGRITDRWADVDLDVAYTVQDRLVGLKRDAGDPVVGVKLGLTSVTKQQQMHVTDPITGVLTASMRGKGDTFDTAGLIHPRIEPEIAFVMGAPLKGPGVTFEEALTAVKSVHVAFEIIDSRYENFSFTLPDVVADNASAAIFFLSDQSVPPDDLDLAAEPAQLWAEEIMVAEATGAAVLGHPATALAMAANALGERGQMIEAGWIVLTGALTDAVRACAGVTYRAKFTHLGEMAVTPT